MRLLCRVLIQNEGCKAYGTGHCFHVNREEKIEQKEQGTLEPHERDHVGQCRPALEAKTAMEYKLLLPIRRRCLFPSSCATR